MHKLIILFLLISIVKNQTTLCEPKIVTFNLYSCQIKYCLSSWRQISISQCQSSYYSGQDHTQSSDPSQVIKKCLQICCIAEIIPNPPFTEDFINTCQSTNNQAHVFDVLRDIAFIAFLCIFGFIVLCRIYQCMKVRANQPGTCQNSTKKKLGVCCHSFCLLLCSCCYRGTLIEPEGPNQTDNNSSHQNIQFKGNIVNQNDEIFEEQDYQFELDIQQCVICLQSLPNAITCCGHKFHTNCIREWFQRDYHCPLCKRQRLTPIKVFCNICFKKFTTISGIKYEVNKNLKFIDNKVCKQCGNGKNIILMKEQKIQSQLQIMNNN